MVSQEAKLSGGPFDNRTTLAAPGAESLTLARRGPDGIEHHEYRPNGFGSWVWRGTPNDWLMSGQVIGE